MLLKEKVALVTGGAQGLGKAICKELLQRGSKVCFCDVSKTDGEDALKGFQMQFGKSSVLFIECDVTDRDQLIDLFKRTKERFGGIDIVINNAGILSEGKNWRQCINVNLVGVIEVCKLADDHMSLLNGGKGGVVLNVASIAAFVPFPLAPVYCATKSGIVAFSRTYAARAEEKKTGLRIVCICPDMIGVGMGKQVETTEGMEKAGMEDTSPFVYEPSRIVSVDMVVTGIIQMIESSNNNGGVMMVTNEDGYQYVHGRPESGNGGVLSTS